jgi:uncharacterized protein (TIGR03437 family)
VAFTGNRLNISVNDVIQAMGRRTPDHTVAQHRFRFGFVLVVAQGSPDSTIASSVQQVETYRQQFVDAYSRFSANLASAETTLNRSLRLSLFPAAGVVVGGSATATVALQAPVQADLAVRLAAPGGFVQVPAQVAIAAGAKSVSFTVSGLKAGVEELLATPADSNHETAFARVQVAAASQLTLRKAVNNPLSGNVSVQLTDANGLPYPGARIVAAATSGSVTPASATTDAAGISGFQWSPDGGAASQLKLSVEAAPTVAVTFNAGSGVPVISAIVNAASFAAGVAPGSLATLFGVNLSGASVLLNGVDVRPFYARDTQVNFYIPAETPTGANVVTVTAPSGLQVSAAVDVVGVQPGIFSGAVLHSGTSVNAITTPVRAGEFIEIYCTGLGATRSDGRTAAIPTVYIGATALSPSYSGLSGFTGLYQVNVQIPAGLPSGTLPLVIASGNAYSNEIKIAVQ